MIHPDDIHNTFTPDPFRDYVRVLCWMCHGRGRIVTGAKQESVICPNCAGNGDVLAEMPE